MLKFTLSPETLLIALGIALSLLFSYIPGFATWYNALGRNPDGTDDKGTSKRLVMLALLFILVVLIFVFACAGILEGVSCEQRGAVDLLWAFILTLIANQTVDRVSPKIGLKRKPVTPFITPQQRQKNQDTHFIYLGQTMIPNAEAPDIAPPDYPYPQPVGAPNESEPK